jgi:hypothetical protein
VFKEILSSNPSTERTKNVYTIYLFLFVYWSADGGARKLLTQKFLDTKPVQVLVRYGPNEKGNSIFYRFSNISSALDHLQHAFSLIYHDL